MLSEKASVIIPTWNSMPELEICLKWIKKSILDNILDETIVVNHGQKIDLHTHYESYSVNKVFGFFKSKAFRFQMNNRRIC